MFRLHLSSTATQPALPDERRVAERRKWNQRSNPGADPIGIDYRTKQRRLDDGAETEMLAPPETVRQSRGHYLKRWSFIAAVGIGGAVAGAGSFLLAAYIRQGPIFCGSLTQGCLGAEPYLDLVPFAALIRAGFAIKRKPWKRRRLPGYFEETSEAITDAALGSILLIFFTFLFRSGYEFRAFSYSRLVFFYDWLIATALLIGVAAITKWVLVRLRRRGHNQRNVVLIRSGRARTFAANLLAKSPELGYQIVASLNIDPRKGDPDKLQRDLLTVARNIRIDDALLLTPGVSRGLISQLVGAAELARIDVKAVPELFGLPPTKVSLDEMGNLPVLALLQEPLPGGRRAFKRAMDLVIGVPALIVALPLLLVIAIAVRLSSDGPIIIRQTRIGMDGRPFTFLKFRSMFVNTDAKAHDEYVANLIKGSGGVNGENGLFKLTDDPRVTPVGRILRRYSLDELPQLINVIRGDMSLVGPRPSIPVEVAMYEDWHRRRLEVRPGMTGLWQVSGRSRIDFVEMVRLDVQYLEHWSPLLDLLILLRTLPALVRGETG